MVSLLTGQPFRLFCLGREGARVIPNDVPQKESLRMASDDGERVSHSKRERYITKAIIL